MRWMRPQFGHPRCRESALPRPATLAAVLCGHAALAGWILHAVDKPVSAPQAIRMDVRLVEFNGPSKAEAPLAPVAEPETVALAPQPEPDPPQAEPVQVPEPEPKPEPEPNPKLKPEANPRPEPKPKPKPEPKPEPKRGSTPRHAPASSGPPTVTKVDAAALGALPSPTAGPDASASPVFVEARFDADYLRNPPPAYPPMSRRRGEQGEVLLLVSVSVEGRPEHVEIRRSSGHQRLDEAALRAVRQWRFVPARRGDRPVAANVVVPIEFRLKT